MSVKEIKHDANKKLLKFTKKQVVEALRKARQKENIELTLEDMPETFCKLDEHSAIKNWAMKEELFKSAGVDVPYFKSFSSKPEDTISCDGNEYINFGTYNYLNLCGHDEVNRAVKNAVDQYGTSAASSRLVSGERDVHQELERALADLYEVEDAVVFVSGHATNVTVVGHLFSANDLIIYDSLIHDSIRQGALLSGAKHISFPHNDLEALDVLLSEKRCSYERVIVIVEGLYSMDGDFPDLDRLVELKEKHKTFLMVDEAHSLGVLGKSGRGLREHFSLKNSSSVDLWMGTLSKTLSGCGGYICGSKKLVEYLRYFAPGFVYSVGLSPPLAAAALKAIELMNREPERVSSLQKNSQLMLSLAKEHGLDTGYAHGYAIVPIIVKNSLLAMRLCNALLAEGVVAQSIVYPAVSENDSRIRFIISSAHSKEQIKKAIKLTVRMLGELRGD
jgi:8-amino-7-oxononanoate synthase